jgi:hypothetical protein
MSIKTHSLVHTHIEEAFKLLQPLAGNYPEVKNALVQLSMVTMILSHHPNGISTDCPHPFSMLSKSLPYTWTSRCNDCQSHCTDEIFLELPELLYSLHDGLDKLSEIPFAQSDKQDDVILKPK